MVSIRPRRLAAPPLFLHLQAIVLSYIKFVEELISFKIPLTTEEAERFERYIFETGLKKTIFVRKAILAYLDRQEQEVVRE